MSFFHCDWDIEKFFITAFAYALPVIMINKLIFFGIYQCTKNACVIDVGYTIGHWLAGIVYFTLLTDYEFDAIFKLCILTLWCFRLAGFLLITRVFKGYQDPRYEEIFSKYPPDSCQRNLAVLAQYLFQGLIVLFTSSTLYWFFLNKLTYTLDWTIINNCALLLSIIAILLEAISDQQIQNYKNNRSQYPEDYIFQEGFWKKSRHPNLFFELSTWVLFAITGFINIFAILGFIGPILLYLVMDKLTVPLTEAHLRRTRGQKFIMYEVQTNKYFPF